MRKVTKSLGLLLKITTIPLLASLSACQIVASSQAEMRQA